MVNAHPVKLGKNERMSFSKINEVLDMPNLIDVQKSSYNWFLEEGLKEVFRDIGSIEDYSGNMVLDFTDYRIDYDRIPLSIEECKARDATYSAPMYVTARLFIKETGEIKEQEIFMGDFPLMTDSATFCINGAERVVVSQLVRSPGVYFDMTRDKTGTPLYSAQVIPNRGAWLEYETDLNDIFYVRIDKNRKMPITVFLRALGLGSGKEIYDMFGATDLMKNTVKKETDAYKRKDDAESEEIAYDPTVEDGLLETYKKIRPGELPTVEGARNYLNNLFFDARRYDLAHFGRYKFNKKLSIAPRLTGRVLSRNVVSPFTGELLAEEGELVSREKAEEIAAAGVAEAFITVDNQELKVMSNNVVDMKPFVNFDPAECGITEMVCIPVLSELLGMGLDDEELKAQCAARCDELVPKHITKDDIFASVNYMINVYYGVGSTDDIDHLGNRRIRSVGELLQNQFRIGFSRMERNIRERMTIQQDKDNVTAQSLINIRPVTAAIKEFFGSSPLSQFMDQTNPLAELTHKRRMSALGPGGLSRDRAGFEVRDVHYSHYGRMCPIETPEGPNIGLINYLASFARINKYGFVEAPYRVIDKEKGIVTTDIIYMTADMEDEFVIVQGNEKLDSMGRFVNKRVNARHSSEILEVDASEADYMDVSPRMVVSAATAMIPFLENDDCNRALMGANMQRQAVPLLITEQPYVATGMEYKAAHDSGVVVLCKGAGTVTSVSADKVVVMQDDGQECVYKLTKFLRSNQSTCVNQHPAVYEGERVEEDDLIADGPATAGGEIALGKNMLIGFTTWQGYNYEDAVLINEKLVKEDIYTSIHIEEYELECRETKLGSEEITREIPNTGEEALKDLDERGIIRVGADVTAGDILVGKVTPKGETELTPEEMLLRAIFDDKAKEVRDTSLRVPHGEYGTVVDVKVFTSDDKQSNLSPGVNMVVRVYIAQKRKLSVGDKMAGRHGNKGVVSRILPQEDMPFLPDGTPLDICLNPLGVPSRMNIGQVLEVHLGYAAKALGWKVMTPVFDGAHEQDILDCFEAAGLDSDGKTWLYDGRTGERFDNRVTVGYMYYLKLHHLVDDKIHARSTGPYSLVTQQPLGGKAQFGGQRFGEMEVWALEAYGAAYTLQEILTVKSDDVVGRVKTYEAIVKGQDIPKAGIPESFRVLVKELQSLALDVRVIDNDGNEVDLKQELDDEEMASAPVSDDMNDILDESELADGYTEENADEFDDFADDFTGDMGDDSDDISSIFADSLYFGDDVSDEE